MHFYRMTLTAIFLLSGGVCAANLPVPAFRDLFNGRDLKGWVNVNTDRTTWSVRDGVLICSGHPIGVMRTERQYENFVLHIEWMHIEPGGNSGTFVWSDAKPDEKGRLPNGVEVQMLELDWVNLNKQDGKPAPIAYVHGELFGVGGVQTVPDNPRGTRSKSIENRCKGRGEWNTYDVVCVDGVIKLSVNGKFVNGISHSSQKKGWHLSGIRRSPDPFSQYQNHGAAAGRDECGPGCWGAAMMPDGFGSTQRGPA